jgi:hypothetical protein
MTSPEQEAGKPASPPAAPQESSSVANPATLSPTEAEKTKKPVEIGGPEGPEPTRFGDWERKGRASDF